MLIELTANLSATIVGGRYTIRMSEYPVLKETVKTYTIEKRGNKERVNKIEMLQVYSDFNNSIMHHLQFRIVAKKEEYEKAMELLHNAVGLKLLSLQRLATYALDAFEEGPDLIQN